MNARKFYNAGETPEGRLKRLVLYNISGIQSFVPLCVGRILLANEKIGYNVLVCMGEVLKKSLVRIIISLKYSLFIVVEQHLCDTQNLVQMDVILSWQTNSIILPNKIN